jgi:serine/threonine protein kinase
MIGPVVKRATHEPDRTALRREAQVLQRARHPGVVALASFRDEDGVTELVLDAIDGATLADAPPKRPTDALRFTAALARTVADLHAMGIAHRSLAADRVLDTTDGRPVLCEFGDATEEADHADRQLDTRALGDLVELIARSTTPDSRGSRAAGALRSLAADVRTRSEPPSAAAIATRAGRLAARHAPRGMRTSDRRTSCAPSTRRRRWPALAVVPVVVLAVVMALSRHAGETPAAPIVAAPATSAPPTTTVGATDEPARIIVGGLEFEVGQAGDHVVVADWYCDGDPSAVLLRPASGEVFLFPSLPVAGETLTAHRIAQVPGAVSVADEHTDSPCPALVVRDAAGTAHPIGDR